MWPDISNTMLQPLLCPHAKVYESEGCSWVKPVSRNHNPGSTDVKEITLYNEHHAPAGLPEDAWAGPRARGGGVVCMMSSVCAALGVEGGVGSVESVVGKAAAVG